MKCEICGREDIKPIGFSAHLKRHNYTSHQYYDEFIHDTSGKCLECGKPTRFMSITQGYNRFCSQKCSASNNEIRKKISEGTKKATEKIKHRNLETYGVEWTTQLESTKEKARNTMQRLYGVNSAMQSEQLRQKHRESVKAHYGVEYPSQSKEIQEKTKQTCIETYGVLAPILVKETHEKAMKAAWTEEAREKRKNTCIEKYNVPVVCNSKEIQEKTYTKEANKKRSINTKKTLLDKYNVECGYQIPAVREKALSKTHSEEAELKRIKTRAENNNISSAEKLFIKLSSLNNIEIIYQYYSEQYPFICDFYLPDKNLYIEINVFWTHGGHWFSNNIDDKNQLLEWKSKNTDFYNNAIYTWTDLDVRKRKIANENNLNYVVLWKLSDIEEWFSLNCPIGKDYKYEYSWRI